MRLIAVLVLGAWLAAAAHAEPPADRLAVLRHGVNITHWFRYPPRQDDASIRGYLGDAEIAALRRAGFTFVRLAVQPEFVLGRPARLALLAQAVARLQRRGLGVVLGPHPTSWKLETSRADRERLVAFWRQLAPTLAPLDARLTYPEVLNEPVFAESPGDWARLQEKLLAGIRAVLPDMTVVLTGAAWGGIAGLSALAPVNDGNVIYSFHFYEPQELTALAAYRPGLDRAALARLPFPMDAGGCAGALQATSDSATRALVTFTCGLHWDSARIALRIGRAAAWGVRHHAAILLGEFGASRQLNSNARLAWIRAVRDACEQDSIGWALWGYDDPMGFGIDPRAISQGILDPELLAALGLHNHS
jgi:endoglucanase